MITTIFVKSWEIFVINHLKYFWQTISNICDKPCQIFWQIISNISDEPSHIFLISHLKYFLLAISDISDESSLTFVTNHLNISDKLRQLSWIHLKHLWQIITVGGNIAVVTVMTVISVIIKVNFFYSNVKFKKYKNKTNTTIIIYVITLDNTISSCTATDAFTCQ